MPDQDVANFIVKNRIAPFEQAYVYRLLARRFKHEFGRPVGSPTLYSVESMPDRILDKDTGLVLIRSREASGGPGFSGPAESDLTSCPACHAPLRVVGPGRVELA